MNQHVIDQYGDFIETKYFLHEYKLIPSLLNFSIPLKETFSNMTAVFQLINQKSHFEIVIERWNISKNTDGDAADDFINYYFLKKIENPICVQIELENDHLSINYWYDNKNSDSLIYIQNSYKEIRKVFGIPTSPIFKVLSKSSGDFYVEEINIDHNQLNIQLNYNDDFGEIDMIINNSLLQDKSGLILLHGKPGTGKTTYIKNLLSEHKEKNFIFVPNDFIIELLQPNFISFLIAHKNSILVIEDAEKVISSRENNSNNNDSVVSTILQLTDGLFSDYLNIKIICTFNTSINNIDKALLRKGRMIAFYEFKELALKKTNILLQSLGINKISEELTISDIYNFDDKEFEQIRTKKIGFNHLL